MHQVWVVVEVCDALVRLLHIVHDLWPAGTIVKTLPLRLYAPLKDCVLNIRSIEGGQRFVACGRVQPGFPGIRTPSRYTAPDHFPTSSGGADLTTEARHQQHPDHQPANATGQPTRSNSQDLKVWPQSFNASQSRAGGAQHCWVCCCAVVVLSYLTPNFSLFQGLRVRHCTPTWYLSPQQQLRRPSSRQRRRQRLRTTAPSTAAPSASRTSQKSSSLQQHPKSHEQVQQQQHLRMLSTKQAAARTLGAHVQDRPTASPKNLGARLGSGMLLVPARAQQQQQQAPARAQQQLAPAARALAQQQRVREACQRAKSLWAAASRCGGQTTRSFILAW